MFDLQTIGILFMVVCALAAAWYYVNNLGGKKRASVEAAPMVPTTRFAQTDPAKMAAVWEKMVAASGMDVPTAIESLEALQIVNRRLNAVNAKETDPQFVRDVNALAAQLIKEPVS